MRRFTSSITSVFRWKKTMQRATRRGIFEAKRTMTSAISDGCSQSGRESLARLSIKTNLLSLGECLRKDLRSGKMSEPSPLNSHSNLINNKENSCYFQTSMRQIKNISIFLTHLKSRRLTARGRNKSRFETNVVGITLESIKSRLSNLGHSLIT